MGRAAQEGLRLGRPVERPALVAALRLLKYRPCRGAAFANCILGVNARTRGAAGFSNSAIAASTLGRMNLGLVNTETAESCSVWPPDNHVNAAGSAGNSVRRNRLTERTDSVGFADFNVLLF